MTKSDAAIELEAQLAKIVTTPGEISDAELDQVTGGIVCRKAGERPLEY